VPGPVNIVDVEVEVKVPKHVQVPHYIDVPVPREVYKEVLVPRQVPRYKDIQVPVEVEQIVTVAVERKVPVPRTVYKHVEEVKRVEVPYEVTVPQEVEEIVEIIQQVQPVIEPIFQTRYEKLPPIREKGKPVYMNGPPASSSGGLPPLPPSLRQQNNLAGQPVAASSNSFANQATPVMAPAMGHQQFNFLPPYIMSPLPQVARSSPLATALNLSVRTAQARPDSPTPADVTGIDLAENEADEEDAQAKAEFRNEQEEREKDDGDRDILEDQENALPEVVVNIDSDKTLQGEEFAAFPKLFEVPAPYVLSPKSPRRISLEAAAGNAS
jgi:hypothetical protein